MELAKVFLGGVIGTSLMTFFSYFLGLLLKSEFGEPKLLNKLLSRSRLFSLRIGEGSLWGWAIHYLTGFLFSGAMALYFQISEKFPTRGIGAVLGCILGLFGVIGWLIMFRLHNSPPKIELTPFLLQLVGAHIVFGLGVTWTYEIWPY